MNYFYCVYEDHEYDIFDVRYYRDTELNDAIKYAIKLNKASGKYNTKYTIKKINFGEADKLHEEVFAIGRKSTTHD